MLACVAVARGIGETPGLVRLRCLIVDDNLEFLRVVTMLLDGEGIEVVGVASSSADAVAKVRELRPEVVLVDIKLGPECGFVLARELSGAPGAMAGVILISTYAERDFADLIADSPAIGFVSKASLSGDAIREVVASGSRGT
jgi:CheY-like chemotaxis protein